MALTRGCRRLGPARASFGRTPRGDSASSFQPNRWPSRDFLLRWGSAIPSSFPGNRARLRSPSLSAGRQGAKRPFSRRSRSSEDSSTPARSWCPGGKPAAGIPYAFEHGPSRTSLLIPIITDDYDGQTDDEGRIRKRMPKTHALALFVGTPATPGHDSPSLPMSTSGVRITPWGNRMSGPRPTSAGSCCARDPTLGPACRFGKPACCRPHDHRLPAEGARSAFDHDRGRRHVRPGAAPPRELSDLWRRTEPVPRLGS